MREHERDYELGKMLRDLRTSRGLSVKKFAKMADVARKTIDNAEAGFNVSVFVLRKLLSALGVEQVTISVKGVEALRPSQQLSANALRDIVSVLKKSQEFVGTALKRLEAVPAGDEPEQLNAQAEDLIRSFTTHVRAVRDPLQLASLQQSVTSLYTTESKHATPRRRRKTA